jgi:tRNA pseudouridine38-40 synthase
MGRLREFPYVTGVPLQKYKLTIAFDGTGYEGWQARRAGRGIRHEIEKACGKLFGDVPEIVSSSRTDAGVHALGLIVHLVVCSVMSGEQLRLALNANLPPEIRIMQAARAKENFHARFDAVKKEYRYQLCNDAVMPPLLGHQAWHVPRPLDLAAMREAAECLIGRHDFRAFTAKRQGTLLDSTRTLHECRITRRGSLITVQLIGEGFLYKMCRRIVGTLVQVGEGKIVCAQIPAMLSKPTQFPGGMIAPAHGLILWKVSY